jgi:putative ABC transport system substrate-binding protein
VKRRKFISLLGGAVAAWPLAARAQQPMPVIGFLGSASAAPNAHQVAAFQQGLKETGYVDGQNVAIEYRWAEGQYDLIAKLATDLAHRPVAVLYAFDNTATALAAKAATSTIPIVFSIGADPVKIGLVASLNRPGGNVTGVVILTVGLGIKRLQILREMLPKSIAVLANPKNPNAVSETADIQDVAKADGQELVVLHASTDNEIDAAFSQISQRHIGAVLMQANPFSAADTRELLLSQTDTRCP